MNAAGGPIEPATRADLEDTVTKMFVYADRRDWAGLRDLFADQVELDWTSLSGGEPATLTPDQIVAGWTATLGGLQATQHLIGNFLVESMAGDEATASCYGQATHFLPDAVGSSLWTLGADYRFTLVRTGSTWKIAAVTMTAVWGDGNQQLMTKAQE